MTNGDQVLSRPTDAERRAPSLDDAHRPKLFVEELGTEMVDLYAGKDNRHFRVHKALLCTKVPYFDRMFNNGFLESVENKATFPDDDERNFDALQKWIYTGSLPNSLYKLEKPGADGRTLEENWCPVKLYNLADKLCLPDLMDKVMDKWIAEDKQQKMIPSIPYIEFIYREAPGGSPPRMYMCGWLNYLVHGGKTNSDAWPTNDINALLLRNDDLRMDLLLLMRKFSAARRVDRPTYLPRDYYHQPRAEANTS